MENNVYLYPYSAGEAHRRDEVSLWRSSHQANIACKQAIEESIREHFDGMHLGDGGLENVLKCFGYKRTGWVLANTIQQKEWDGRFSPANRQWSKQTYIPPDPQHNSDFVVGSHPAVLNGFILMTASFWNEWCRSSKCWLILLSVSGFLKPPLPQQMPFASKMNWPFALTGPISTRNI